MKQAKEYGVWCSEPTGGWWFSSSTLHGKPPIVFKTFREAEKKARAVQKANGGAKSDVVYLARIYKCPPRKLVTYDVPSKGKPKGGFKRLIGVVTPEGLIPCSEGVARKFLRMTLAERTKFVELFGGFTDDDWRRFKRWIRKLNVQKGEK